MAERTSHTRLTRELILEEALVFINEHGVAKLTLRKLGLSLGFDHTAFYRHYRNKEALLAAVSDRVLGQTLEDFRPSEDWAETLRDIVSRARNIYLEHPLLALTIVMSPDPLPNNARTHEQVLLALTRSGLREYDVPLFADAIARWVIAVSMQDSLDLARGRTLETRTAEAREGFSQLPSQDFPLASHYAPALFPDAEDSYNFGVELIIESIRSRVLSSSE